MAPTRATRRLSRLDTLASKLAPALPADHFRVEPVERMSFSDSTFDVVISSAVMHFARDEQHWLAMFDEMWRVLKPGGLFFARLATTIGHESRVQHLAGRRYIMPDGDERFLVDEDFIMKATRDAGAVLVDPLKTSVVQNARSMMTWVMRKRLTDGPAVRSPTPRRRRRAGEPCRCPALGEPRCNPCSPTGIPRPCGQPLPCFRPR